MSQDAFQEVALTFEQRLECESCGKKFKRQRTFTQTVNPFNKNPDGTVKTSAEVYEAVKAEGEAWRPTPLCGKCLR